MSALTKVTVPSVSPGVSPLPAWEGLVRKGTVMVVDDNPNNLALLEDVLQPWGYEVRSFPRGRMALAAIPATMPDLILLDINMPEMSGYEVCKRLKSDSLFCGIPVIFLSALNGKEALIGGFECGAVDYISKPFEVAEVKARVDTHVRLWQYQQQVEADNGRLHEMVRIQEKKTADAHMETIFALAKLAEARDDAAGKHLERVQALCRLLASGLRDDPKYQAIVDARWITNIAQASPLHDIGKVAIPDRILLTPGPLSQEEFAIMKTHATLGAETLRAVHARYPENDFIGMGIEIAQSHHERWNGTGYPQGLSGENIPLSARILALADCYDAIRSQRCYKAAVPHYETMDMLLRESGKHFDPAIVAVFANLADTIRDAWERISSTPMVSSAEPMQHDLAALSHGASGLAPGLLPNATFR